MRRLEPLELLDLFDAQGTATAIARLNALIALCCPEEEGPPHSPGARNAQIMAIRHANFGRRMSCLTPCPACEEVLEIEIDMLDFSQTSVADRVRLEHRGHQLAFRLPTPEDIDAAARSPAPLDRLVSMLAIDRPDDLEIDDPALLEKVSAALDAADPLGCIVIEARCPACGAVAQPVLDPLDLIWRELASVARRLEDEVHVLARAYGWREQEILALPDARRRRYVERVLS